MIGIPLWMLAGCAPEVAPPTGWPTRLLASDGLFTMGASDPECTDVVALIAHDEAEWSAALTTWLPPVEGWLPPEVVAWPMEDALVAFTDCSFVGLTLELEWLDGTHDGAADATYSFDIPPAVGDTPGRTFAIHAFPECGECELTSVVTER